MSNASKVEILNSLEILANALNVKKDFSRKISARKNISIPVSIFTNRRLGMLENCVIFLKDKNRMSFHEIAILLNRDDRTIWASYYKAKKKEGDKK